MRQMDKPEHWRSAMRQTAPALLQTTLIIQVHRTLMNMFGEVQHRLVRARCHHQSAFVADRHEESSTVKPKVAKPFDILREGRHSPD